MPFTHLVDEDIPLVHHSVGQTEESWRVQLELDSLNRVIHTITILISNSWISFLVHELLVDSTKSFDDLHWNSYNFEAMNRQVAPMA